MFNYVELSDLRSESHQQLLRSQIESCERMIPHKQAQLAALEGLSDSEEPPEDGDIYAAFPLELRKRFLQADIEYYMTWFGKSVSTLDVLGCSPQTSTGRRTSRAVTSAMAGLDSLE